MIKSPQKLKTNSDFPTDKTSRNFSTSHFTRKLCNEEGTEKMAYVFSYKGQCKCHVFVVSCLPVVLLLLHHVDFVTGLTAVHVCLSMKIQVDRLCKGYCTMVGVTDIEERVLH